MTGTTISGSYTTGITLTSISTQNPATISTSGHISATTASALYGTNIAAWSIYNYGTLIGHSRGVFLAAGGTISNAGSGVIAGGYRGIDVAGGPAQVTNAGSIAGGTLQGVRLAEGGTVTNLAGGTIMGGGTYAGIDLIQGGTVNNQVGAIIENGVKGSGSASTVINGGTIQPVNFNAVYLTAGGVVSNTGSLAGRIKLVSTAAAVDNSGTINGIALDGGGTISNAAGGYIGASGPTTDNPRSSIYIGNKQTAAAITDWIVNSGTIGNTIGATAIADKFALMSLTNMPGGVIFSTGGFPLPDVIYGAGILYNAGTITGSNIRLTSGSTISNAVGGLISAGIGASGGNSTLIKNSGTTQGITTDGGTLINTGTIEGLVVVSGRNATVINAGTIGSGSDALFFAKYDDLLVVDPGAVFQGTVNGNRYGEAAGSTLELAVGSGGIGTLSGLGTSITNFASISLDSGAVWTLKGQPSGLTGVISGFSLGDTIDLTSLNETVENYASGTLTLVGDATVELQLPGTFTTASFRTAPDAGVGTNLFLACFAAGTLIATECGAVDVAMLRPGDLILALDGKGVFRERRVKWVGYRRIDLLRHSRPELATPMRIHRGAFGEGVPFRDLLLSPDHAIYAEDVLIPVKYLSTPRTILPAKLLRFIEYFHVELERHSILLAEGLPVESYLDTGDRSNFENGDDPMRLHPDFSIRTWEWEALGYAPLVVTGAKLDTVRAKLLAIAEGDLVAQQDAA